MYPYAMATSAPRAGRGVGGSATPQPAEPAARFSAYAAALKEAGVGEDDLRLLRELAEMNAHDLSQADEPIQPSRVLL
jgi:hypothetical protein